MANHKKQQFCKKGHDKHITGVLENGRCKICRDEYNKNRPKQTETPEQKARRKENLRKWRAENPEKNREYDRKYYWQNPEKRRAKTRKYTFDHKDDPKKPPTPERIQWLKDYRIRNRERDTAYRSSRKHIQDAYNKDYYVKYREEIIQASCDYYWAHQEEISEKNRQRHKANPEKKRLPNKVAKQNRRDAIGELTVDIFKQVWESGDGICAYCFDDVSPFPEDPNHWRLEHCIPVSRGGTHFLNNLVVSCKLCNSRKYMDTVLEHCLGWPWVTDRYDFFVEETLNDKDLVKLHKLHAKYR